MVYERLKKIKGKLFFSVEDLADALKIKTVSACVLCSRYVKKGLFIRLKKNFYILEEKWNNLNEEDFLRISNFLQVPSYVSFLTALCYYEVSTQVQRNFFESASLKRSARFMAHGSAFHFYKLKKNLYFDFVKKDNIFIASREKAFVDAVYLYSFGKYKLDFSALDLSKLNRVRLKQLLRIFPAKTQEVVRKICKI